MVAPERDDRSRGVRARWLAAGVTLLAAAALVGVTWQARRGQAQGNEGAAILRLREAVGILRHVAGDPPLAALGRRVRVYAWPDRFEVTGVRTLLWDPDAGLIYSTYPRHPRSGGRLYEGKQEPPAADAAYRDGKGSPGSTPSENDLPAGVRFDKQSSWDHAVPTRDGNIWLPVGG